MRDKGEQRAKGKNTGAETGDGRENGDKERENKGIMVSTDIMEIIGLNQKTDSDETKGALSNYKELPGNNEGIRTITTPGDLFVLRFSRYAWEKSMIVVKTVFEIFGNALEAYWLLLGDEYVKDIVVPEQIVSQAYVRVEPDAILKIRPKILESNLKVLGWGHSHANFGVFFSGTDKRNQKTVFIETDNYVKIVERPDDIRSFPENKGQRINNDWHDVEQPPDSSESAGGNAGENETRLDKESIGEFDNDIASIKEIPIKYSYGCTLNVYGDVYAEIIWTAPSNEYKEIMTKIPVEIIGELSDSDRKELSTFKNSLQNIFSRFS